jgi:hypothetical protein
MFFLSDRNFDLTNDTLFLLHLSGNVNDPDAKLDISYRLLDQPYGVPPYAPQTLDSLDTNDARVLDAFESNGTIQWVNNTMDFYTGRSAVFHGWLDIDDPFQTATGNIIAHPTDYLGYPGLAWTGSQPGERDAIIVMSHSSAIRHPGGSAVYSDGLGEYSEFVTVIEGTRSVNMLSSQIERWGDYVGIQRLYHQPGSVWVSMSYGRQGNVNEAWIAKLARHDESTSTKDDNARIKMSAYPNPSDDYVSIDIDNPEAKQFEVILYDLSGHLIKTLYDGPANHPGKANISFSLHSLPAGQYLVKVIVDDKITATKSIVRI